jgi:hypothetical protein
MIETSQKGNKDLSMATYTEENLTCDLELVQSLGIRTALDNEIHFPP